jgi:nitroimidazol reductase NimA-like FMN-containing flavoprotein (pyridoxamine 5'-phosphate oxidase superfamily)
LKEEQELFLTIHKLLLEQKLGALATRGQEEPWASLIAFTASDNLDSIYFATPQTTRKYSNLVSDPRCSLLIDNRGNLPSDFSNSIAVTATGVVQEVGESEKPAALQLFLKKHPYLETFTQTPTCALICLQVNRYNLVRRFQEVMEYYPGL